VPLASPENDFGDDLTLGDALDLGLEPSVELEPDPDAAWIAAVELELDQTPGAIGPRPKPTCRSAGRRELRWFYTRTRGRVPAVGDAAPAAVSAASRIAGWLAELVPTHRGAFVLRHDGRRWPVRLLREFGGLTSIVVRFMALERSRGPNETLAKAEEAVVTKLLADIGAVRRLPGLTTPSASTLRHARKLRRLRLAAYRYVQRAERAYFDVRGGVPCAVPPSSREGA
jgi:hypothetical protein